MQTCIADSSVMLYTLRRAGTLTASIGHIVSGSGSSSRVHLRLTLILLWVLLWRMRSQWRRGVSTVLAVPILGAQIVLRIGSRCFRTDRHAVGQATVIRNRLC